MYGTAGCNPSTIDSRARDGRADYRLENNSREDATLAHIRLSRLERGLLAFDSLIRRMANHHRMPHELNHSKLSFQHVWTDEPGLVRRAPSKVRDRSAPRGNR
jgi:hypothetical protein